MPFQGLRSRFRCAMIAPKNIRPAGGGRNKELSEKDVFLMQLKEQLFQTTQTRFGCAPDQCDDHQLYEALRKLEEKGHD